MSLPFSPNRTFIDLVTQIPAGDMNDLEVYLSAIYAASLSLKKMRLDGSGNAAVTPTSLLELKGSSANTTPVLAALNGAGNIRWLVDHNGFPTGGRTSIVHDEWLSAPGAGSSPWGVVLGTGAAIAVQSPVAGFNAPFLKLTPSSTGGATNYALFSSTQIVVANTAGMSMVMEFEIGLNAAAAGTTSNTSWFFGLDAGVDPGGADVSLVGLLKRYGIANYQFLSGAGAIQVFTNASIATPPTAGTNPTDRIRIELHGSASPLGAYQARFYVNEVFIGSVVAANLPTTTMRIVMGCFNEGGAPSGSPLGYVGPLVCCWNRFATPPAL